MRIAILDNYNDLAQGSADWSVLSNHDVTFFNTHEADEAKVIAQVGGQSNGMIQRVSIPDYEANLRTEVQMVQDAGATPVFFLLADQMDTINPQGRQPSGEYRIVMRRLAAELGVPLIDAAEYVGTNLQGRSDLYIDAVHPSATGAMVYAELLDSALPPPHETGPG